MMGAVRTAGSPAGVGEWRDRYPPIADCRFSGELQTEAFITKGGAVVWYRCPRIDSASVFASLLDHNRSGHFQIHGRKQCQHMR